MPMNRDRPLFAFKLRDVDEIVPWGRSDALSLGWFGLTDGWYWMNVGQEQLFVGRDQGSGPTYVDYQVVRLWEDVLDLLPAALEPVPGEIAALLEPGNDWLSWYGRACDWATDSGKRELLDTATGWATRRWLDTGHLVAGPNVWFCRVEDRGLVLWDNRNRVQDGKPIWKATSGRLELPIDDFHAEVSGFHDRLMHAMSERVMAARDSWTRKDVRVDVPQLADEQRDRQTWLANALRRAAVLEPTDWEAVAEGIQALGRQALSL